MPIPSIKINMNINGLNYHSTQHKVMNLKQINEKSLPKVPSSLNSPMVSRIFNVKPGCGSCGK